MQDYRLKIPEQNDESLAEQVTSRYLPYWPIFLLAVAAAIGISFLYLRYKIPIYQADASILIKDERKGNEDKLTESLDLVSSKKTIENEVEIMKSRNLMVEVVKKLHLYAPVYVKGRIHTVLGYSRSPISIQINNPDSLYQHDEINFIYNESAKTVILNNQYEYPLDSMVTTPFGQLRFVLNKNYTPDDEESDREKRQMFFALYFPENVATGLVQSLE